MRRANQNISGNVADSGFVKSQTEDAELIRLRRGQIVQAAVKLFSERGFYRTTVQQVAEKAHISAGLIYHYARTKEDILLLALVSVLEGYKNELPNAMGQFEDPLERLHAGVRAYCGVVDHRREATVLAYRSTKSLPGRQREAIKQLEVETNRLIEACLEECIAVGYFRDVNVQLTAYHFVTFAHTWALKYWRLASITTLDDYFREGFDFFVRGLVTPKGWRRYLKLADAASAAA
ncbi:TetR/AcrR family transcriptional regulator [Ramlibacter sp. RBP-2]|uniref:TetR/AcrR family transcriptional regulator n=1 Tax=Ramlibacter lithotrophicus TaxID=2606681 RepID=A0A7X6DKL5_9BURK|nr:TetR/AcrR family transcriptional regulator [Ramlibacter lithotrophicus]NKE68885.1 TetR/AcrR family transcriptional regulator [Ramlibacter lithotrophicus]